MWGRPPIAASPAPAGAGTAAAGTGEPGAASAQADRGPPRSGSGRRGRAGWRHRGRRARRCRWTSHSRPTSAGTGPRRSTGPKEVSQPSRHAPAHRLTPAGPSRAGHAVSYLLRYLPGVHEAHDLVPGIGGGPEHEGAAAIDDGDAVLPAVAGGGIGDAARTGAPVHPHVLDAELGAFAHGVLGDLGPGSDHHRLDPAGDRCQVRVAPVPLDLVGVRVDREHLVAALAQPRVHVVAPVGLGRAGYPGDRDALVRQELGRGVFDALHGSSLFICYWWRSASIARSSARTLARISRSSSPGATST